MIRMLVDRCHIGESHRSVIYYVKSRMKKDAWRSATRQERRALMKSVCKRHDDNRKLYREVMRG